MEESVYLNALDMTEQADAAPVEEAANEAQEIMVEQSVPGTEARADSAEQMFTRQEVDDMIRRKSEFFKRGMENDPAYQLGKSLLNQYHDMTPAEAYQKALQEQTDRRAKELAENPEEMAKAFLRQQNPQPRSETVESRAGRLASEIRTMELNGQLPQNFNLEQYVAAYPDFITDAEQYGVRAAVKMAGMSMAPKLPQSTRPQNVAQPQSVDVSKMTSKQFADFEAKVDAALRDGRKITF